MVGFGDINGGEGGITGGAAAPSQASLSSGINFGGNAGIGSSQNNTLLIAIAVVILAFMFLRMRK